MSNTTHNNVSRDTTEDAEGEGGEGLLSDAAESDSDERSGSEKSEGSEWHERKERTGSTLLVADYHSNAILLLPLNANSGTCGST